MKSAFQTTLKKPIKFSGIGLHSGSEARIKILPADSDKGIIFKRTDLNKNNIVQANYKKVTSAKLCTTLENNFGVKVSTVEHLLAALYIANIDNVIIEINNQEVPIMDGSAKVFLDVLKKSEKKILKKRKKFLIVTEKVLLEDGKKSISIEPNDNTLEVDFELNYENQIIGNQKNTVNFDKDNLDDVSNSRTFCLYDDIEKIKKAGLARGGSLKNAVVVSDNKVINEEGLRNKKEFVNHKILDLVGDFMLSGYRILGKVKCNQGGHLLTNMFLRKLLQKASKESCSEVKKFKVSDNFNLKNSIKFAINA